MNTPEYASLIAGLDRLAEAIRRETARRRRRGVSRAKDARDTPRTKGARANGPPQPFSPPCRRQLRAGEFGARGPTVDYQGLHSLSSLSNSSSGTFRRLARSRSSSATTSAP